MNSEILRDVSTNQSVLTGNAAVSGRRKFLRSAGALGAASALSVLAGGAGMLLPSVASARISNGVDDYKYKLGTWVYKGVNCDVYRKFHIDNEFQGDVVRQYQYVWAFATDDYYRAGTQTWFTCV